MPLRLQVFATDPEGSLAPRIRQLGDRLRQTYCAAARGGVEVLSSPDAAGTPVGHLDDQAWKSIMGGKLPKKTGPQGPTMGDILERELEGLFRGGTSYDAAPEAITPDALRTTLYPHQRKALHWMI